MRVAVEIGGLLRSSVPGPERRWQDNHDAYDDPRRQPQGIQHVMVNGDHTLLDRHRTDRLPGHAIRRA
jgi:N-acyl-D-amino-acid deacylase